MQACFNVDPKGVKSPNSGLVCGGIGMNFRTSVVVALSLLAGPAALADTAGDAKRAAAIHWRELARLDLDAAYELLKDSHPAMAPELGDTAFIARVETAYAAAKGRIEKIDSFYGLRSTLGAFGNSVGDKHVGAGFGLMRQYSIWPGFLVRAQGSDFVVTRAEGDKSTSPAEGAKLVSCDGVVAQDFARARIGEFHANWDIEAQRATEAWRLFVNDRNPFVEPPKSCRFDFNGASSDVTIAWNGTSYDLIAPVIARTNNNKGAGFGVRRLSNGAYWISMEGLEQQAEAVLADAKRQAKAIAAAPYVVVDVRGNGGGSSSYGDRLADILLKSGPVSIPAEGQQVGEAWRVSPGNAAGMEAFAADVKQNRGDNKEMVQWAEETAAMLRKGVQNGDRFVPALPRDLQPPKAFTDPSGGAPGTSNVYLLTDYACFSSCLLLTDTFKRRGAVQVGLPTDAATRYMEVRSETLPSRLASFSTLQKVALGAPAWFGPYQPSVRFDGDIGNTPAVERWIERLASGKLKRE